MATTIKQQVVIEQENPPILIRVTVPTEAAAKRIKALDDKLLSQINMAVQGYHQPDIPELADEERKGKKK